MTVELPVAAVVAPIASGAVESPVDGGVAVSPVVGVVTGATIGVGAWAAAAAAASWLEESLCELSSEDLLEDLPVDLPSPLWALPVLPVAEAALPEPAALLPAALALALFCWPEPVGLFELAFELESVCVLDELLDDAELALWDCDWELAEDWLVAAWGAGDWLPKASLFALPMIMAAKLSAPAEADGSGRIDFDCALSAALAAASNVTLTTASLLR